MDALNRSFKDVDKGLMDLFKFAYLSNCELEEENLSQEDYDTLEDLDSLEILENFKDLILDLLETKKEYKHTDKEQICKTNEQFEQMI